MIKGIRLSKKMSAAVAGIALVLLQDVIGLTPDAAGQLVNLLMVYIGGQGIVDVGKAIKG